MINTLVALVVTLLIQVQGPNVPPTVRIQALQLANQVLIYIQTQSVNVGTTPVDNATSTPEVIVSTSTPVQDLQQVITGVAQLPPPPPPAPKILVPAPCTLTASAQPNPNNMDGTHPSLPYSNGWNITLKWNAGDAYLVDRNATFTFDPTVQVAYYKSNGLDSNGNGTAYSRPTSLITTYMLTVNVKNSNVQPTTSCSTTVDLTDLVEHTGVSI